MNIKNSIVLVTGSNRGIGKAFVQALLDRGVGKVYAGARQIDQIESHPNVIPVELDVTNSDHIARILIHVLSFFKSKMVGEMLWPNIPLTSSKLFISVT